MKRLICTILTVVMFASVFVGYETHAYNDIISADEIDISHFNFPVLTVTTENGAPIVDKNNYVSCTVSISNTEEQYCISDETGGIRFRGNSTLTHSDKKPYRIKFDKKQNLFDMGKAKSWVLLANAFDKTMVRNALAFEIARELGLEYTSHCRFVNVYLNGECLGLYLLCEQTQTGENRVEIEEDETGKIDTGYLIEFVGNADTSDDAYFNVIDVDKSLFPEGVTVNWRTNVMKFIIKTPEKEFCSSEQIDFISEYCNSFNKAILTHDWETFAEMCDIDSFVKFFIVNTVMNNGDGGYQIYFYKKENGGKVYAGPVWDFDQSSAASSHCTSGYSKWYYGTSNPWFDSFTVWDEFMNLARECYDNHIENIKNIIEYYTHSFYFDNEYDFRVNDAVWHSVTSDYWRITSEISALKTYEENFEHLGIWFANRISWLDSAYHALGEYTYNNDETCNRDGTESAVCKDCGYISTRRVLNTVNPQKHVFTEYIYNNDTTCFEDGTMTRTCSECGIQETAADPQHKSPGRHTFGEYVYNNDATDSEDGTETAVCRLCGKTDTRTAEGTKLPAVEIKDTSVIFTDVNADSWYKEYVDYAYYFGLFKGMSDTEFEPNTHLNRAMFVTVLARSAGVNTSDNDLTSIFDDVDTGKYYTAAVKWAADSKITNGISEKIFDPSADVTREQICAMLVRYAEFAGIAVKSDSDKIIFNDDSEIHDYAREAVYICQSAGIVNGTRDGERVLFRPRGSATRAETAKILGIFYRDYIAE